MKKTFIFSILTIVLLTFFLTGCSVPILEKTNNETKNISKELLPDEGVYRSDSISYNYINDVRLTYNSDANWNRGDPAITWNEDDEEYGMAYMRDNALYFARINSFGLKTIDILIGDDCANTPAIVWTGNEYGVAWSKNGYIESVYFTRLSSNGSILSTEEISTVTANGKGYIDIVWTGSEYGVVWVEGAMDLNIWFARVDASGRRIGSSELWVDQDTNYGEDPSIAWDDVYNRYCIVWQGMADGAHEIYFTIISSSGELWDAPIIVSIDDGYDSMAPSIVWTGSEYGLAWHDERDGNSEIYFTKLNSIGLRTSYVCRISDDDNYDSEEPSLEWTGSEFGAAWHDTRDGYSEIYFSRISSSGSKIGSDVRSSDNDNSRSEDPNIVWTGTHYGLVWLDNRHGGDFSYDFYFGRRYASGTKIVLVTCKSTPSGSISGYYYIRHINTGKYLTHWGSSNGLNLYYLGTSYDFTQKWYFSESTSYPGYYKIISDFGRRITGHLPDSTELTLETSAGGSAVLWRLYDSDNNGTYLLRNKYNTSYRIFPDTDNYTAVELLTSTSGDKYFEIIPVDQ